MNDVRGKAAGILGPAKMRQLEEAGLEVVKSRPPEGDPTASDEIEALVRYHLGQRPDRVRTWTWVQVKADEYVLFEGRTMILRRGLCVVVPVEPHPVVPYPELPGGEE